MLMEVDSSRFTRSKIMANKSKKICRKVGRSSVSGRFVKVKYAKKHPRTTQVETIKCKKK
jgi:hypothetical protein